jgi:porin
MLRLFLLFVLCFGCALADDRRYGISSNPGATAVKLGTGDLGDWLHIPRTRGIQLGGLWMADANPQLTDPHGNRWTGNNLIILDLYINFEKAIGWKGGSFGTEFLQFNGQPTNIDAGVVQGYNSITGAPPFNRSELYQLWLKQDFFDEKASIRVGKTIPIYHFNNVSKPVPTDDPALYLPSVSGLIYVPLFVNSSMLGVIGGYYNSVYGAILTVAPTKEAYINLGFFDGNLARGVQTGLRGPHFNGYYFSILETGYGWAGKRPGIAAIGGWYQSGKLKADGQEQTGTGGFYLFGSQALWIRESTSKSQGNISAFYQFGWNNSRTLPIDLFFGMGLTGFALVPKRPNDSFGFGLAWGRLNPDRFSRYSELVLQGYYQAQIYKSSYFQPAISYIPNPGAAPDRSNVCAITARLIVLF